MRHGIIALQFRIMPFELGNNHNRKGYDYESALKRSMARIGKGDYRDGLNRIANKLVRKALKGEAWALIEIGNRIDGKPTERLEVTNTEQLSASDILELLQAIRAIQAQRQPLTIEATVEPKPSELP